MVVVSHTMDRWVVWDTGIPRGTHRVWLRRWDTHSSMWHSRDMDIRGKTSVLFYFYFCFLGGLSSDHSVELTVSLTDPRYSSIYLSDHAGYIWNFCRSEPTFVCIASHAVHFEIPPSLLNDNYFRALLAKCMPYRWGVLWGLPNPRSQLILSPNPKSQLSDFPQSRSIFDPSQNPS